MKRNDVPGSTDRDRDYWRDVGTIDSFFDAHMDLISTLPIFNLYNSEWPIHTANSTLPPAKFVFNDLDSQRLTTSHDLANQLHAVLPSERVQFLPRVLIQQARVTNRDQLVTQRLRYHHVKTHPRCRVQRPDTDRQWATRFGVTPEAMERAAKRDRERASARGLADTE
jgi:glucose-1-phosphate adenylyltransferase